MLVKLSASPFKAGLIFQKDANKKLNNFVKRKDVTIEKLRINYILEFLFFPIYNSLSEIRDSFKILFLLTIF